MGAYAPSTCCSRCLNPHTEQSLHEFRTQLMMLNKRPVRPA